LRQALWSFFCFSLSGAAGPEDATLPSGQASPTPVTFTISPPPARLALPRPAPSIPILPLSTNLSRRYPARESVFEPEDVDYDERAPLEPPRNLTDMARLAARRVVDRLEAFEHSPTMRDLRRDVDAVSSRQEEALQTAEELRTDLDDLGRSHDELRAEIDGLGRCHDELADSVNQTIDRLEEVARSLRLRISGVEHDLQHYEVVAQQHRELQLRLRFVEFCLVCAVVFAGTLLSLLLKI